MAPPTDRYYFTTIKLLFNDESNGEETIIRLPVFNANRQHVHGVFVATVNVPTEMCNENESERPHRTWR